MQQEEDETETTTPPSRYPNSPVLTPPPTDEKPSASVLHVLEAIKHRREYSENKSWQGFHVGANDYEDLERRISEDEDCVDKLHCGYFPLQKLFVIRMLTPIHGRFLKRIENEILLQLRRAAEGPEGPSSEFAKDVENRGSETYKPIDPKCGTHDPDGSFGHLKERFPGVMLEVAYSQQGKMLRDLAEHYILGSDLAVQVMVGFDLPYKETQATFSVWRPRLQREGDNDVWSVKSETQVFRHSNGEANLESGAGLLLHLRDFASVDFCEKFGKLDETIFFSCNTLCTYLTRAEIWEDFESAPKLPGPVLRKRYRTQTPDECLATDDEKDFVNAEERAAKRVDRDDSSYEEISSR